MQTISKKGSKKQILSSNRQLKNLLQLIVISFFHTRGNNRIRKKIQTHFSIFHQTAQSNSTIAVVQTQFFLYDIKRIKFA